MKEVQIVKVEDLDLSQYNIKDNEISINTDGLYGKPFYGSDEKVFKKVWSGALSQVNTPIELEDTIQGKDFFIIINTNLAHKPKRICPIKYGIMGDKTDLNVGGKYIEKAGYFPNGQSLEYYFYVDNSMCKCSILYNNPPVIITDIYVRSEIS